MRVLEALDRERVTVASSLGIRGHTGLEWLKLADDTSGEDLHEVFHNQPGYPSHRLLEERASSGKIGHRQSQCERTHLLRQQKRV